MICVAFNTFREAYSGAFGIDVGVSLYVVEAGERWFVCDWEGLRRVGQPLTRLQIMPGATNSIAWVAL